MNRTKFFGVPARMVLVLVLASMGAAAHAFGVDVPALMGQNGPVMAGLAGLFVMGEVDGAAIMKALDSVEAKLGVISTKAEAEMKDLGKTSTETKSAIEALGVEQRTLADRLLIIEQKAGAQDDAPAADETVGGQFTKHAGYDSFVKADGRIKTRVEVKNTVTNVIANTFSERRPNLVEGAFRVFTIEDLLTKIPTSANAIDWVRENVFTNAAAETAEGATKPQSSITFLPGTMPVSTIAHWIKITRQLAMDNAAMAAYINRRMVYGVNLRVENQIVSGNGASPNINGLTNAGNFTPHGYTAALLTGLGLVNNRFDLIGKMIGDCALADYPAEAIVLNTADWWTLRLSKDDTGRYILGDPGSAVPPTLFGLPVVASNAMVAGRVWVGSLSQAATLWIREGVAIDLSDSDGDNFINNLVTIRAERRAALTVEKPGAARYGELVPA
ncbi:phage major capsid protein, HK97 family [Janthinobacterium sp. OK676]|uniref:phage major capsid protein n=1 Tax=Janthinobacterium sp. OK676 TaxID=1855295 RepID=UPI000883CBFF|nr:phage major capsid protein [Janthinobacterium sp. OK676]SDM77899.1 phage major capsid protein, HK97 family [Janthinobacterium sp. OK676]